MPVIRVSTDLRTEEYPSDELLAKISESFRQFGHGTVAEVVIDPETNTNGSAADIHVHESTDDYACKGCTRMARDRIR